MLEAFWRLVRTTLVGSMIPFLIISPKSSACGIITIALGASLDGIDDHCAVASGILGDKADRLFDGLADDIDTGRFITFEL